LSSRSRGGLSGTYLPPTVRNRSRSPLRGCVWDDTRLSIHNTKTAAPGARRFR
jgi:hypothetical protein